MRRNHLYFGSRAATEAARLDQYRLPRPQRPLRGSTPPADTRKIIKLNPQLPHKRALPSGYQVLPLRQQRNHETMQLSAV